MSETIETISKEIAELEAQRAALMAQLGVVEPEEGGEYYLLNGHATVVCFYDEDNIKKVRVELRHFNPRDGVTVTGEPSLCSMPIDTFKQSAREYKILKRKIDEKRENQG